MRSGEPVVTWRGVSRIYDQREMVGLLPTDLTLFSGQQIALVGPSGSGKSTALNLLGLLDRPTSGSYRCMGRDTAELNEGQRCELRATFIGFVFQTFHLLPARTAADNVGLGLMYLGVDREERRGLARRALDRVGLSTKCDVAARHLSGGEKQRVAIARAIIHQPALLLADEPTGNLDQANGIAVMALLSEVMTPSMLQIIVTHDQSVASQCDTSLRIIDGRLGAA